MRIREVSNNMDTAEENLFGFAIADKEMEHVDEPEDLSDRVVSAQEQERGRENLGDEAGNLRDGPEAEEPVSEKTVGAETENVGELTEDRGD